jgi:signal transduction histidine kinase
MKNYAGQLEKSPGRWRFPVAFKGNLMVAVPLVFMLVFTGALIGEINQAEQSRERLSCDRELLFLSTKSAYYYEKAFASVYFISIMQIDDPLLMKRLTRRYSMLVDSMLTSVHKLKVGVRANSTLSAEKACALELYMKELLALMNEAVYKVPKQQRFGYLTVHGQEFMAAAGKLDAVIGPLREADRESPSIMAKLYNKILFTMQKGLIASVLIAVALGLFFSADISRRVKKLCQNVRRFAAGQELSDPAGGADEIADLELSFRAAVSQLRDAEETKRRFFAAVTCDMELPIARVQQVVANLIEGKQGELTPAALTRLTTVQNNLNRITLLVQDLRDVEDLETGKLPLLKSAFKTESLLQRTRQMLESAAAARRIIIAVETADLEITADDKRLGQILLNFLSNAVKYSPEGSTIVMRCCRQGEGARFEVCDRGPGIDPEAQARLFTRFQQISLSDARRGKGTGLGLSVSKLIAESHGGTVGVESEPGKGSIFWFTVPLAAGAEN